MSRPLCLTRLSAKTGADLRACLAVSAGLLALGPGLQAQSCSVIVGVSGVAQTPTDICSGISPSNPVTINTQLLAQATGSVDPASLNISCNPTGGGMVTAPGYCYNELQGGSPTGQAHFHYGDITGVQDGPLLTCGYSGCQHTFTYDYVGYSWDNTNQIERRSPQIQLIDKRHRMQLSAMLRDLRRAAERLCNLQSVDTAVAGLSERLRL